jgi:hypothetical protein
MGILFGMRQFTATLTFQNSRDSLRLAMNETWSSSTVKTGSPRRPLFITWYHALGYWILNDLDINGIYRISI